MLTGAELSASIDKLLALRKEIWQAFVDTFIMLGISTTVAIVIGGLFGVLPATTAITANIKQISIIIIIRLWLFFILSPLVRKVL